MIQPGPCILCDAKNYPLSMGGPTLCPACDTGFTQSPAGIKALRAQVELLQKENEDLHRQLAILQPENDRLRRQLVHPDPDARERR